MGIHTVVDINAPAETVWAILMDFPGARACAWGAVTRSPLTPRACRAAYPSWNPFIKEISGEAKVGQRLRAKIAPPGQSGMTFKPVVMVVDAPRQFLWRGSFLGERRCSLGTGVVTHATPWSHVRP